MNRYDTVSSKWQAFLHSCAKKPRPKESGRKRKGRGRMEVASEEAPWFLHRLPSLWQVGQQADSGAWDTDRCHSASPCLPHTSGGFSVGSSKPGIRPVVSRCQNVQPEHGLVQLCGNKPLLALAHPQLSLQSTLVSWKKSCYGWSGVIIAQGIWLTQPAQRPQRADLSSKSTACRLALWNP